MNDPGNLNPLKRFSGLAELYDRARPQYPQEALQYVLNRCSLKPGDVLIDVGCGTGIASRTFARLGLNVVGIEPNYDMLAKAKENSFGQSPIYKEGSAENTGLSNGFANAVLAAQSFHWFDWSMALAEFARILKEKGWAIVFWNTEDKSDRFTKEFRQLFKYSHELPKIDKRGRACAQIFMDNQLFDNTDKRLFSFKENLDKNTLLARVFSYSYAPKEPVTKEKLTSDLEKLFSEYEKQGTVTLHYHTEVLTGRKRA